MKNKLLALLILLGSTGTFLFCLFLSQETPILWKYPSSPLESHTASSALQTRPPETTEPLPTDPYSLPELQDRSAVPTTNHNLFWKIFGHVRGERGEPVPGAEVFLYLEVTESSQSIFYKLGGPLLTNNQGQYRAVVASPGWISQMARVNKLPMQMQATAVVTGYLTNCSFSKSVPYPNRIGAVNQIDITLDSAACLQGYVRTPDGKPVEDAEVNLFGQKSGDWLNCDTSKEGYFEAFINEDDLYHIYAEKIGVGIAAPLALVLMPDDNTRVPDLILNTLGHLKGRVTDPNGIPYKKLEITAHSKEYPDADVCSDECEDYENEETPFQKTGFKTGSAYTDDKGQFIISGLLPGQYYFQIPGLGDSDWELDEERLPRTYATNGPDIDLNIKLHRIRININNEVGERVPEAWLRIADPWPPSYVYWICNGSALFYEHPGTYKITCSTQNFAFAETEITIKDADYFKELTLRLERAPSFGRLALAFFETNGDPITQLPETYLQLNDPRLVMSYKRSLSSYEQDQAGRYIIPLPAGDNLFSIQPKTQENRYLSTSGQRILIDAEKETSHNLSLVRSGRLCLTVIFEPTDSVSGRKNYLNYFATDALDKDTWSLQPKNITTKIFHRPDSSERLSISQIKPGIPYYCSLSLKPGMHSLTVRGRKLPKQEIEFKVEPGRVSSCTLFMKPKE